MEVQQKAIDFCSAAIAEGKVPVLLGYSFGKAQEILAMLKDTEFAIVLHEKVLALLEPYEQAGIEFPNYAPIGADELEGKVVIAPPGGKLPPPPRGSRFKTAMFSGWGLDPSAKYRYRVDEVFPLSDHADYDDSVAFVEDVAPKLVLTTHGYATEFASDLRRRGYEAWSLGGDDQLDLPLGDPPGGVMR